jgi:nucleoside-triphosphatase THEP1
LVEPSTQLIIWTGPKHSGKSTQVARLADAARGAGFEVAGILAQSIYAGPELKGFDILDLQSGRSKPLARRDNSEVQTGPFRFLPEGLELGFSALSRTATESAELIIIDEFGPHELSGRIWRKAVDSLVAGGGKIMLLVVRKELVMKVSKLYQSLPSRKLPSEYPESKGRVIEILRNNRQLLRTRQ